MIIMLKLSDTFCYFSRFIGHKMSMCLLLMTLISTQMHSHVLIITHNYVRPDLIELQAKTFKKFLKDPYTFVVFNDANNGEMCQQIDAICKQMEVQCIRVPQEIHSQPYLPRETGPYFNIYNYRHVDCIQYSLDMLGFDHDGIVLIIDSDAFLIRPFSIEKYMEDKDISARENRPSHGAFYFSPIICFLKMNQLPDKRSLNFNCGRLDGHKIADSGGYTYYYWQKHPELKIEPVNILYSHQLYLGDNHLGIAPNNAISITEKIAYYNKLGFNDYEIKFLLKEPDTFEFYLDHYFIHFRGGSTVATKEIQKLQLFRELINDAMLNNNLA